MTRSFRPASHRTQDQRAPARRALAWSLVTLAMVGSGCAQDPVPGANGPAAAATGPAAAAKPKGPRLRLSDTLWDWGVATAGLEVRHFFVLHNDGDQPVHIRKARPT